ncbi:major facilitator superfamily domain-containing protein [Schizophyllum amplum]|uniref:Major facilitator superfamily domain-containing protein n=1 Tax=Schizophyllum amplum TaxID=97359 RepID=A0A550CJ66_9AGAR|nr:major facilitator superfamily domain-containing protein [Auriculariopsis ampla]
MPNVPLTPSTTLGHPAEGVLAHDAFVSPPSKENPTPDAKLESGNEEWTYPDGGLRAWSVVLGCFMLSCAFMGSGLVFGVFQDTYHTEVFPDVSVSTISLIGGILSFCSLTTAYVAGALGDRYGYMKMIVLGCILTFISVLGASFSTKLYQLFLCQGVFQGISQGISMPMYMALPSQWFLRRRAFATGVAVSGAGIGGAVGSLVMRPLIAKLGYKHALLVYACMNAFFTAIACLLLKVRTPPWQSSTKKRWLPAKVDGRFYSIFVGILIAQIGYLSPFYYITTYTRTVADLSGGNTLLPVIPLVILNLCAAIGRIGAGQLADIFGAINVFFLSFFLGGILQMVFWPFTNSYASVIIFGAAYGLTGGVFMSLVPPVCAKVFGMENLATITGLMVLANGPGQLAGPPLAGLIFSATGDNWAYLAVFSGAAMFVGALCTLYVRFQQDRRIWAAV